MRRERIDRFKALLGSWRSERPAPEVVVADSRTIDGVVVEELRIISDPGGQIPAVLCRPRRAEGRCPAVLYAHAHGNRHEIGRRELIEGRPALADPPYGPLLASLGFVVLCLDMPAFGDRAGVGEVALAKARHWHGATLMGDMLCDLATGIDVLAARDDVDPNRIAALGLSMGATHACWLAALDQRIAAVAHLCAFASLHDLVVTGAHDLHGPYMTVPGLLAEFDSGTIASLVSPRPQLVCVGLEDPLTPQAAFERAWGEARAVYDAAGSPDHLQRVVEPASGHRETAAMRAAVLAFLNTSLKPAGAGSM